MPTAPSVPSPARRHWLMVAALAGAATAAGPHRAGAALPEAVSWRPPEAFLADLPRQLQALDVPGVGIAVVEDGAPAWSHGNGLADRTRGVPVGDATVFEAASLSKPVFAYIVLRLVDRGELDLDRPLVDRHRPEDLGTHPWLDAITARDVLRHSTGLPNWRKDPGREPLVPAARPGTRIDYSGEAFFWLQRVIETITGESLDRTARRLLFEPAGMHDSTFAWDAGFDARSVHGHRAADDADPAPPVQGLRTHWRAAQRIADRDGTRLADWRYADAQRALAGVQRAAPEANVQWAGDIVANAAASLRCTVRDYARFLACVVDPRPAVGRLAPATRAAMLSKQIDVPGRWTDKTLGWNLEATPQGPVLQHSGSNAGLFKTFALGDPARRRALVVMTNGANGAALCRRVVRAATGLDLLSFDT